MEKPFKDFGGKRKGGNTVVIVLVVLALIGFGVGALFFSKYQSVKNNPQAVTSKQTNDLVSQVGKLMTLPTGETPTVATVQDKTKLKDQPFFKDSANGDKLLIYTNAKQAIIYRESNNKIINVGPIALSDGAAAGTATPTPTPTPKKN